MTKQLKILCLIFVLALVLRIYKLGAIPFGFHADEVRVGWNAVSILETGKDDHGNKLSLYYNSFGDYRPTGIFYATILSVMSFGRTEFAVRFPTALIGALTIFPIYLLTSLVSKSKKLGILAAILLSISPWHIETSRATSEVVISTFLAILAIYFFINLIKTKRIMFAGAAIVLMVVSYLFYHSIRLTGPLFLTAIAGYYWKDIVKQKILGKYILLTLIWLFAFSILAGLSKEGRARLNQVSIVKDLDVDYEISRIRSENNRRSLFTILFDNKGTIYFRKFIDEYSKYFSSGFLIGNLARPFRYTTPGVGLLTYAEFIVLILGVVAIFRKRYSSLPIILLVISPLPAALTIEDSPNLQRAFLMLPFLIIISACGLGYLISFKKILATLASFFLIGNSIFFLHMYFNHSLTHKPFIKDLVLDYPSYRDVGAKELVEKIDKEKNNYGKIIVTSVPDNLYPWYAFFTNKEAKDFNENILRNTTEVRYKNILFSGVKCPSDDEFQRYKEAKLLVVDNWECASQAKIKDGLGAKIVGEVNRPDGSNVYKLLERE